MTEYTLAKTGECPSDIPQKAHIKINVRTAERFAFVTGVELNLLVDPENTKKVPLYAVSKYFSQNAWSVMQSAICQSRQRLTIGFQNPHVFNSFRDFALFCRLYPSLRLDYTEMPTTEWASKGYFMYVGRLVLVKPNMAACFNSMSSIKT